MCTKVCKLATGYQAFLEGLHVIVKMIIIFNEIKLPMLSFLHWLSGYWRAWFVLCIGFLRVCVPQNLQQNPLCSSRFFCFLLCFFLLVFFSCTLFESTYCNHMKSPNVSCGSLVLTNVLFFFFLNVSVAIGFKNGKIKKKK